MELTKENESPSKPVQSNAILTNQKDQNLKRFCVPMDQKNLFTLIIIYTVVNNALFAGCFKWSF